MHPACPYKKPNHLQNSFRQQFWVRKTFSKPASLKRKPKRCASAILIQQTSKNEPTHGPKNGIAWRSHFSDRMHRLVKTQRKALSRSHFWERVGVPKMRPQNRKGRPVQRTKNDNCVQLSNKHIELEQRRPAHAKPDFN